ncbi:actin-like ATPase domain-containing protein [Rhizopogon vinicolor AM-OR11-026]|uniref:Actin-like ATPase domain-containing protein n=1 Tax=Rhizopogon vinicolor AM-OR11-026 TaxID=1314800 RepID=A0A1B7MY15_9AGAM|nr:actin-like ATPase domain-containing protein [Rhizopogon vinicolor AM-OR11-026]
MSTVPSTPRAKTSATTPAATPTTTRVAGSHVLQASPHYATTRRHSLYGTEDRVVIDPGSRIWKVGFSGEGKPRDAFYADAKSHGSLWSWSRATDPVEKAEQDKLLEINLERCMRSVFHESLLADPKSRKVILVEHPLMPLYIKDMLARILFNNLQVPSISFASSHLLSLLSVGRITGLVLDCGHLESTALPIFAARPLFPQLRTTPLAGSRFSSHLSALLLLFGSYLPPPTSLSAAVNVPAANRTTRVPQEILTDAVIEDIKTRCCFVSGALYSPLNDARASSPPGDEPSEHDLPPSSDPAMSESEFSRGSIGQESAAESEFSIVSHPVNPNPGTSGGSRNENHLQVLANMYMRHSTATDLHIRVVPPVSQQTGTGRGTLVIPGWIRERAAEVLFEGGDVDESSVAEVILDALLKVPLDLRKILASSILITGGTAMLPGFIPRLHAELLRATAPLNNTPSIRSRPTYDRYAALRPLIPHFAILNNPAPVRLPSSSARANMNAGKAPAFTPSTMAWVGGSLAGALKTGGVEVAREKWDEADPAQIDQDDDVVMIAPPSEYAPRSVIPDWTRGPLPVGAPPAVASQLPPSPQAVGA